MAREAMEWIKDALDNRCPGGVVSYWRDDQVLDPIVIPSARASVAALVCALRGVVACAGGRVIIAGGGVGVIGIAPALAGGVLDRAEAVVDLGSFNAPRRMMFAALAGRGVGDCRVVDAQGGHELRWLVRTGGQWSEDLIGGEVQRRIRRDVQAMRVHAETLGGRVERMVMITLPDRAALERMRGLVAEGGALRVKGIRLEVFPLTCLRSPQRGARVGVGGGEGHVERGE